MKEEKEKTFGEKEEKKRKREKNEIYIVHFNSNIIKE